MMRIFTILLFCLQLLLSFPVLAGEKADTNAVLSEVEGEVLLYQGDRYLPVQAGQRLKDGDRLMIMEKSKAHVVFDNDCEQTWEGAKIVDVNQESCSGVAALWVPCLGVAGGAADDEEIVLTQLAGSALVRRNGQNLVAKEGQVLEEGDELKLDGEAEISYEGACVTSHNGKITVKISRGNCPIAELRKVEGKVLVNQGTGFVAAGEGYKLKDGWKVEVAEQAHTDIIYYNGCDESWDGHEIVAVDADKCPLGAAVPMACTPAVFGNMTLGDTGVFVGSGILIGVSPKPDDQPPVTPRPVSP
ncbi:hypothetical protein [Thiolapillus brandeum]|uniref:Organic solvent tolerance-like N-terminal domain-containing protein n=1 Tax=Thiolapillus brandeum TaxID=1076588 RepID=A0A7U6GHE2_9GAMM|nr:hypothetical protein [Thiolapillus brandeum]BAO43699.1 hypothetical protein TBH_C0762 [Thiolapillus brandeum]